ncbi:galactose mutarotase-like protein [Auriculariales sp. MPI-PUGE-AT-0066]|nr:galactose mutarotase-like protein [Auriculariales sp. MPI-PUGE-AT-0066]
MRGLVVAAGFALSLVYVRAAADDIETLRERRKPFIHESVLNVQQAPDWLDAMAADGTWADVNYLAGCPAQRSNWPAQLHWQRIVGLASVYTGGHSEGNLAPLVGDEGVLNSTFKAIDWWFERDFNDTVCLASGNSTGCPCDTPGLWNTNWFSNVILIPRLVGQTCILLEDKLRDDQLHTCIKMTSRSFSTFGTGASFLAGANILDIASIGVAAGILSENTTVIGQAFIYINNEIVVHPEPKVDGIKPDGSFSQHSGVLYNGNYGKDFTNAVLQLSTESAGTTYEASKESQQAFSSLINGTRWMIYQNTKTDILHYDFSTVGRFIAFSTEDLDHTVAVSSILINTTKFDDLGKLWNDKTLQQVAHQLETPTKTANIGNLRGNRMFWANDFMVHRGKKYMTSLKMFSSRTTNSECVNLANPLGFHLSDGTVYTHIDGTEYENIAAAWDWNLIPGITTDYARTPLACGSVSKSNPNTFVGGVSDESHGIAVMRYTNPITGALAWSKAWFFLDDDVQHVMVNDVSITGDHVEVYSVLDQRRLQGSILVDGRSVAPDGGDDARNVRNFTSPRTLVHGGAGYVFGDLPDGAKLSVSAGNRTGSWSSLGTSTQPPTTVPLFAAWISHPSDNLTQPIEYTAFPGVSSTKELQKAHKSAGLVTLANLPERMAVWDSANQIAYGIFWTMSAEAENAFKVSFVPAHPLSGKLCITSSQPLVLIAHLSGFNIKNWTVTVADPTQQLSEVTLKFTWTLLPPLGWGKSKERMVKIALPSGGNAGSSVSVKIVS